MWCELLLCNKLPLADDFMKSERWVFGVHAAHLKIKPHWRFNKPNRYRHENMNINKWAKHSTVIGARSYWLLDIFWNDIVLPFHNFSLISRMTFAIINFFLFPRKWKYQKQKVVFTFNIMCAAHENQIIVNFFRMIYVDKLGIWDGRFLDNKSLFLAWQKTTN